MRILVSGSRSINDIDATEKVLLQYIAVDDLVIHGACPQGIDGIVDGLSDRYFFEVLAFPADWDKHGKAAGPIRNRQMIEEGDPDILVAIWDGRSKGTKNTIDLALVANIETHVHFI